MRLACAGLFSWLEKGATVVTPTPLLAAVAAEQFSNRQLANGVESWQRPPIVSIGAWLTSRWQEARYNTSGVPTLLSTAQERVLWQRIIQETNPDLFDVNATALLAAQAARLLSEWLIPAEGDAWNHHEDVRQFQQWHRQFRQECTECGWASRADLWRLIPEWLADGGCTTEKTVFLGFSKITPAFSCLREALGAFAQVEAGNLPQAAGGIRVQRFSETAAELDHAARWARSAFEQDPSGSIGIIVPDLRSQRSVLERIFNRVLYPSAALSNGLMFDRSQSIFHINAAAPLSDTPLITSALLLLELARNRMRISDAGAILRCPFIKGAAVERNLRALADAKLRSRRAPDVNLNDLEYAASDCELLKLLWPAVRRVIRQPAMVQELPGWSKFIADLLAAAGWPGEAELSSGEQEIVDAWKDALSALSTLGLVAGAVSLNEAIMHLRRILGSVPETGTWSSPIQILDPADAAGIVFDRALATGLSDETWAPRVKISPLVPFSLQREHGVPGSGPESLRAEAQRATTSLLAVSPVLTGTYSGQLSPAIGSAASEDSSDSDIWQGKLPRQSYPPAQLDQLEDGQGPPYRSTEVARGGSAIIKAQSQCPFRAFAEYRLLAKPLEDASLGFDARERGGFLHKALQIVWQQLETQDRLRCASPDEVRKIVEEAVATAVQTRQFEPFQQIASAAERRRLRDLILQWLDIERARKLPFTVETVEEERYFEVPGLRLRLRIDRTDRLQNGNVVLIDYKSGSVSRNKLKCPRPPEPQLLVYASALQDKVDGVFFAEMQSREPRAIGLSREKHFESRSVDVKGGDWESYLGESRLEVVRLADEFLAGYAAVHPISGACNYCPASPICRVNEAGVEEEAGD